MNATMSTAPQTSTLTSISTTITILIFLYIITKLFLSLYLHCFRSPTNLLLRYRLNKTSPPSTHQPVWAIVTGPTRGIGLSIATQLVRRGFSVLLVGRSNDKLTRIQSELRQLNENTQVEFVEIDFNSTNSHSSLETLMTRVTSMAMDVGLLVNNVGIALDGLSYFTEISPASLTNLCEVNMRSSLLMSRIILPLIVRRGSGGIINMSSMSGLYATPMLSPYAATKAFVHSLSISLFEEVAGLDGIDIMSVTPGFVATSMATSMFGEYARVRGEGGAAAAGGGGGGDRQQHHNFSWCGWSECGPPVVSADECAESVLCQLGSGQRHTSGHWKHGLQQFIQSWIPSEVLSDVTHTCMRRFRQERRREEEELDERGSGWNGGSGHSGSRMDIVRLPSVVEVDERKEEEDEEAGLL